jgi:hypothetical protein
MIETASDAEGIAIKWSAVKCPSKTCGKFTMDITTCFGSAERRHDNSGGTYRTGKVKPDFKRPFGIGQIRIEPRVSQPLSVHVPEVVKQDYEEACLIVDLSPKASATLCRRALQGMIRDFWGVVKANLHDELAAIRTLCDPELFDAMMGLKSVGNIGAHPEKDINLLIDVEEGEAAALIELLRILDKEWYVARSTRAARLAAVKALGEAKAEAKKPIGAASPARPSAP